MKRVVVVRRAVSAALLTVLALVMAAGSTNAAPPTVVGFMEDRGTVDSFVYRDARCVTTAGSFLELNNYTNQVGVHRSSRLATSISQYYDPPADPALAAKCPDPSTLSIINFGYIDSTLPSGAVKVAVNQKGGTMTLSPTKVTVITYDYSTGAEIDYDAIVGINWSTVPGTTRAKSRVTQTQLGSRTVTKDSELYWQAIGAVTVLTGDLNQKPLPQDALTEPNGYVDEMTFGRTVITKP